MCFKTLCHFSIKIMRRFTLRFESTLFTFLLYTLDKTRSTKVKIVPTTEMKEIDGIYC